MTGSWELVFYLLKWARDLERMQEKGHRGY
jgi:hypothetical protein